MHRLWREDCAEHCLAAPNCVVAIRGGMGPPTGATCGAANQLLEAHQDSNQKQRKHPRADPVVRGGGDLLIAPRRETTTRSPLARLRTANCQPTSGQCQLALKTVYDKLTTSYHDLARHLTLPGNGTTPRLETRTTTTSNANDGHRLTSRTQTVSSIGPTNHQMNLTNDTNPKQTCQAKSRRTIATASSRTGSGGALRAQHQLLMVLFAVCLTLVRLQPLDAASATSPTSGSQLARQLIDIHQRNQILKQIHSQASVGQQQPQQQRQETTSSSWDHHHHNQLHQHPVIGAQSHADDGRRNREAGQQGPWLGSIDEQPPTMTGPQTATTVRDIHLNGRAETLGNQVAHTDEFQHVLHQLPPRPTTPTLNKQLAGPPQHPEAPFYEFGFATTNALQLDLPVVQENPNQKQQQYQMHNPQPDRQQQQHEQHIVNTSGQSKAWKISTDHYSAAPLAAAESIASPQFVVQGDRQHLSHSSKESPDSASAGVVAAPSLMTGSRDSRSMFAQGNSQLDFQDSMHSNSMPSSKSSSGGDHGGDPSSGSSQVSSGSQSATNNHSEGDSKRDQDDNTERSQSVRAPAIESRQRRRIFNRILKKAEWNHLFLELSKVFLRYFLDLALKDIIGKQSGASVSDSSTTGRKKLDAQSELADMLKEFVKTAISNI